MDHENYLNLRKEVNRVLTTIGAYKELNGGKDTLKVEGKVYYYTSMKDDFQETAYPHKWAIIYYLRHRGEISAYSPAHFKDVISGKTVNESNWFKHDDKYSWHASIPYYIEKYNLRLSEEIENHIIDKLNKNKFTDK